MIIIYTGSGKGKTSASLGQTIRALGQGFRVAFGQFMKQDGKAGEQALLRNLLGNNFYAGGKGFFRHAEEKPAHREAALLTLNWAFERLPQLDMLVLDESLYALGAGLLTPEEVHGLIDKARRCDTHLVLSGRGLPDWLEEEADLITEMTEIKHPWQKGVAAARGIEF